MGAVSTRVVSAATGALRGGGQDVRGRAARVSGDGDRETVEGAPGSAGILRSGGVVSERGECREARGAVAEPGHFHTAGSKAGAEPACGDGGAGADVRGGDGHSQSLERTVQGRVDRSMILP